MVALNPELSFPQHARVVIVGGGIMGCGLAYHLTQMGWTDIVLLEKAELTSGSTWHAAGQITYSTSSYSLGKCIAYNINLYQNIEQESGQSVSWHGCGSLRLAYTADEEDWLQQCLSVSQNLGLPIEIISPRVISELHPFYNLEGVRCALYTPNDGHVDPSGITFALAQVARQRGANIIRKCQAQEIKLLESGEWLVRTDKGDIRCQHLVNAAGTYARQIALQSGYDLPATSMTHHYFVTERVPEFLNLEKELPVIRDDRLVSGYVRMEQKSGLIGIYEKSNPNSVWLNGTPWEAEHELFEPDYDRIMPWLQNAMERMPVFANLGIKKAVHGAISHPPDGNPLIGPAPGLTNYWCCCGCQIGIGWGPALTRELASWMVDGASNISMREFDPRRFGQYADSQYQITKAKEDYVLRHELPFPHFNRLAGRPVKTNPLYFLLQAQGAVFEEVYGWERPRWFALPPTDAKDIYSFRRTLVHDIVAQEVAGVRERVGVMDITAFSKVEIVGANAAKFLDQLIPNRLPSVGRIALTHLLTESGRIELEMTVACIDENRFYLVCAAFFQQRLLDYLNKYLYEKDIVINNLSESWGALAVNGPRSRSILSQFIKQPLTNESFPWLGVQMLELEQHRLLAMRVSYAGELGWELHAPNATIAYVYEQLFSRGQDFGLVNYGSFAMNSMRMEKKFQGAQELTNEVSLPEANVMRFVNLEKNFIGREATLSAVNAPLRWLCVYLQIESDGEMDGSGGETIFSGQQAVGAISSIAFGHRSHQLLAFAYVLPSCAQVGTQLEVLIMGHRRRAKIITEAVFDPKTIIPRQ